MTPRPQEPDFRNAAKLFEDGIKLQRELVHWNLKAVKLHTQYMEWLMEMKEALRA